MFCYVHIPFCESKCKYCKFASFALQKEENKQKYVDFLVKSIDLYSSKIEKLDSIYFGGGTPTSLSNSNLQKIFSSLKNKFGFKKRIEITLETTPQNITLKNLDFWINKLKITRLSLGIQSLNDKTLVEIGRKKSEIILKHLQILDDFLKNEEMANLSVNVDFIIGLPFVKKFGVLNDLKFILGKFSFINHVSLYMLEDYFYPKNWKNLILDEKDFLGEYSDSAEELAKRGFQRYEISNFSRKGFECKHNLAYWSHKNYIGFGLGAHSFIGNIRFANAKNFKDFYNSKLEFSEKISLSQKFLEKIMFDLRTSGISSEIYATFKKSQIDKLRNLKLIKFDNKKRLVLTNKGILLYNYVLSELF